RGKSLYSNPNTPPCPVQPWPVLGHFPMFRDDFRAKMREWREQYGGIYLVYFGRDAHIVVGDFGILKEIMTKHSNNLINTAHSYSTSVVCCRYGKYRQHSVVVSTLHAALST
ncbi:unnamed protein product, partial [Candidula unifasciata]